MTKEDLLLQMREVIEPYVENKALLETVTLETDLLKDLKINSAHLVDIILDLEDKFKIEIDDESAEKMFTVGAAVEVVQGKL